MKKFGLTRANYIKLVVSLILSFYFLSAIDADPRSHFLLYNVDLIFHEAGHSIFMFFGDFLHILGGSLFQVLLPCAFLIYFTLKKERFSASVILFWVGQNVIEVAWYMSDAIKQELPLLGGGTNDWTILLSNMGVIEYTNQISGIIHSIGVIILILAAVLCFFYSVEKIKPIQTTNRV